jgi:hypothetical protein
MLVVLRVKEIPSDSSEGILFLLWSGDCSVKKLITTVENFNYAVKIHFPKFN